MGEMKVLLVADLENWILGQIAGQLSRLLAERAQVTVLYSRTDGFLASFRELQKKNDIVHFLSSSDIIDFAEFTYIPCVATLWHMVNWGPFDAHAGRIDGLFVCSQQWQQRVSGHISGDVPMQRMRYGLDVERFSRDHSARPAFLRQSDINENALVFGFAGSGWSNEGNRKGLDWLWDCFLGLRHVEIPFILHIVGPHWPMDMIPPQLRSHTVLDEIPSPLLPRFYSSLDYYVCTSRVEGVPYPVLEAMSCECVVLSTPAGIVPEVFRHSENGFVLQEGSVVTDFLDAVNRTAFEPDLRSACGRMARDTVVTHYSWDTAFDPTEHLDLYKSAIRFFRARSLSQRIRFLFQSTRSTVNVSELEAKLRLRSMLRCFKKLAGGR